MRINEVNLDVAEDDLESLPIFQPRKEIKYSQRTKDARKESDQKRRDKKGRDNGR